MKNTLTLVILGFFVLGSLWLLRLIERELNTPTRKQTPLKSVATAYQTVGYWYGADNRLQYQINSAQIDEYSQQAGMYFIQPTVQFYEMGQLAWQARSDLAELSADKERLLLEKNIHFEQFNQKNGSLNVLGERMQYDAAAHFAYSDLPVEVYDRVMRHQLQNFALQTQKESLSFNQGVQAHYQSAKGKTARQKPASATKKDRKN